MIALSTPYTKIMQVFSNLGYVRTSLIEFFDPSFELLHLPELDSEGKSKEPTDKESRGQKHSGC